MIPPPPLKILPTHSAAQIVYPHWLARLLHHAPLFLLCAVGVQGAGGADLGAMGAGALLGLASALLGMLLPAAVGAIRADWTRELAGRA